MVTSARYFDLVRWRCHTGFLMEGVRAARAWIHKLMSSVTNSESGIWPAAHRDEGHLLQVREMPFFVSFSFRGRDLLNRRLCWEDSTEIFPVHLPKGRPFHQIVQVNCRGNHLIEFHVRLFQVVEKVSHRLANLIGSRSREYAAIGPRNKSTFRRTI